MTSQLRVGAVMGNPWESTVSYPRDDLVLGGLWRPLTRLNVITSHRLDRRELIPKPCVAGSSPAGGAKLFRREIGVTTVDVSHTIRDTIRDLQEASMGEFAAVPMTHVTGGLSASVSTRMASKPASSRTPTIRIAAAAVVSAVAPGHRGWETIAMSPPPRNRPAISFNLKAGSDQKPMLFTARTLSNRRPKSGRSSIGATVRDTRPERIAAALRRAAWARITGERSIPKTSPRVARRAISRTAMPGPNPISSTQSEVSTSRSETAHALRFRFEGRSAISHPTKRPEIPRGFPNCETTERMSLPTFGGLHLQAHLKSSPHEASSGRPRQPSDRDTLSAACSRRRRLHPSENPGPPGTPTDVSAHGVHETLSEREVWVSSTACVPSRPPPFPSPRRRRCSETDRGNPDRNGSLVRLA